MVFILVNFKMLFISFTWTFLIDESFDPSMSHFLIVPHKAILFFKRKFIFSSTVFNLTLKRFSKIFQKRLLA